MPVAIENPIDELMRLTVLNNPYIPVSPTILQSLFLLSIEDEVLYGGAAGGGKSIALLAAALQYVMMPQYDAILLRRSFQDLNQPKALIPLSMDWLSETDAEWNGTEKRWYFPSGATLTFGHMNSEKDKYNYQGAAFNFVGYDELTQFTESMYTYLFSRIRRSIGINVPGRMRAASNPGGDGHDWVKARFATEKPNVVHTIEDPETHEASTRLFIPARLQDNAHLDQRDYIRKLGMLDAVTRAQLLRGDWDIKPEGNMFKRGWFKYVDAPPRDIIRTVRGWDMACTPPSASNPDPDYTSSCKISITKRRTFVIHHATRMREGPAATERHFFDTTQGDGKQVAVRIEQEPGSAGKTLIYGYANRLAAFDVRPVPATGSKEERASQLSAACERGDVELVTGSWNSWWVDAMVPFPGATHDDPIDAAAHAYNDLTQGLDVRMPDGPVGTH